MAVHFDQKRMMHTLENHMLWWQGKLPRPLINGVLLQAYPRAGRACAPVLSQSNCHDFSWTPAQVIDAVDEELSRHMYFADGYPLMNMDCFGPGVLAAFCGARLDNTSGSVWFFPCTDDLHTLHVQYDPENKWAKRIKDIYRAGLERWEGSVIMGFPDLGGVMDVLASLCGTEKLLYALVDEPDEVKRLVGEIETAWYAALDDFTAVLRPQGAYSDWNGILSREPSYIIQCDFCYMIGQDMFREFVLDTLRRDTKRLSNTIYHLDGVGELAHLEQILSLPELNAVQWVYGAGKPEGMHWLEVYRSILNAGKQLMIVDSAASEAFLQLVQALQCAPYGRCGVLPEEFPMVRKRLEAMGCPV